MVSKYYPQIIENSKVFVEEECKELVPPKLPKLN